MYLIGLLTACQNNAVTKSASDSGQDCRSEVVGSATKTDSASTTEPTTSDVSAWQQVETFMAEGNKNIVVYLADTLRADHLPVYCYERDTTPLTGDLPWVVVEDAYSVSSWTPPAVASMLSGVDTHVHGVRAGTTEAPEDYLALASFVDVLNNQGYVTALFSGSNAVVEENGLASDFQQYQQNFNSPNSQELVELATAWLDTTTEPFLVWVQPMDTHQPWDPADEDLGIWADLSIVPFSVDPSSGEVTEPVQQEALRTAVESEDDTAIKQAVIDLYDEEILGLDRQLSILINHLDTVGLLDNTLVVFVSDHGETLFDQDDSFGHAGSLRQELVHVPFMVYNPSFIASRVTDCLISLMDFFPTLNSELTIDGMAGYSIFQDGCRSTVQESLYRKEPPATELSLQNVGASNLNFKVEHDCETGGQGWYDLAIDPAALTIVGEADPALAETLSDYVTEILSYQSDMNCVGLP